MRWPSSTPQKPKGKVDWRWVSKSTLPTSHSPSPYGIAAKETEQIILGNPVPEKAMANNKLLERLYKGSWDMYRKPGRSSSRDVNKPECPFAFGYANDYSQNMRIVAVASFASYAGSALFFAIDSVEVKKLTVPWEIESDTIPQGTEVVVMKLSSIGSQIQREHDGIRGALHTWDLMIAPYKNGWKGTLVDKFNVPAKANSSFSSGDVLKGMRSYRLNQETKGWKSLNACRLDTVSRDDNNKKHIVYLLPSKDSPAGRTSEPVRDDTGVAEPQF